eukprot:scaffold14588_cov62-Isochrysis_galbana.AAC.1
MAYFWRACPATPPLLGLLPLAAAYGYASFLGVFEPLLVRAARPAAAHSIGANFPCPASSTGPSRTPSRYTSTKPSDIPPPPF